MSNRTEISINGNPVKVDLGEGIRVPRVACLGPEGTYTEAARYELLGNYLKSMDANFLPRNGDVVQ